MEIPQQVNQTFFDQFEDITEAPLQGGTSKVLFATRKTDGLHVAIKLVPIASVILSLAFQRELHALGRLSHPNIVRLVDRESRVTYKDRAYGAIVIPRLDETLDQRTQDNPFTNFGSILRRIIIPLSEALAYAHENGTVHRDIKPSNIMFEGDVPKILDFGVSKFTLAAPQNLTVGVWNSGYFTPDLPGTEFQQDVYSFSMTVLEAWVGEPIRSFERAKGYLLGENSLGVDKAPIPKEAGEILLQCLSYDPALRPKSMKQVHQLWKSHLQQGLQSQGRRRVGLFLRGRTADTVAAWDTGPIDSEEYLLQSLNSNELWISRDIEFGDAFLVITPNFSLKVKFSLANSGLEVLSVKELNSSSLGYLLRSALPIEDLGLSFELLSLPKVGPEYQKGIELLNASLSSWESRATNSESDVNAREALLVRWSSLLTAWELNASNGLEHLHFSDHMVTDQQFEKFKIETLPDAPIQGLTVKLKGKKVALGQIVDVRPDLGQIYVQCNERGRRSIPDSGTLEFTMSAGDMNSFNQISKAIEAVKSRTTSRPEIGELIAYPDRNSGSEATLISSWKTDLDDSKKEAVSKAAAAKDFCVVQGPPGTGKTQFIAELVWQELQKNPDAKILLASQTHVALDNAIERIEKIGISRIVRIGDPSNPSIAANSIKFLAARKQEKWAFELQKRAEGFAIEEAKRTGLEGKQVQALIEISAAKKALLQLHECQQRIEAETNLGEEDNVAQFNLGVLMDESKTLTDEYLARMLRASAHLAGQLTVSTSSFDDSYLELLRETILVGVNATEELDRILETIDLHAQWLLRAAVSKDIAPVFMLSQQIVAGTCLGFASERSLEHMSFDLCILDEASKATSLESLVPLTKASRWVLVGDTNQLQAKYFNLPSKESELQELSLSHEVVTENLFANLSTGLPQNLATSLTVQYRMHPSIGKMISRLFYEGALSNGTQTGRHPIIDKYMLNIATRWLSTSDGTNQERREGGSTGKGSRYNETEVRAIAKQLKDLDIWIERATEIGLLRDSEMKLSELGIPVVLVLSPYSAQLSRIYQALLGWKPRNFELKINTVDAVQGQEADLVFFSPVLSSNDKSDLGFLGNRDFQRVNVALSRARHGLKIVGDSNFWSATDSPLGRCLAYIEKAEDCELSQIEY